MSGIYRIILDQDAGTSGENNLDLVRQNGGDYALGRLTEDRA